MRKCLAVIVVVVAALEIPRRMNRPPVMPTAQLAEVTADEIRFMALALATRERRFIGHVNAARDPHGPMAKMAAEHSSGQIRKTAEVLCSSSMLMEFPDHQLQAIKAADAFLEPDRREGGLNLHFYPIAEYNGVRAATVAHSHAGYSVVWFLDRGNWEVADVEGIWVQ